MRHAFSRLGGDSIQSIKVVARAQQAGIGLTVRQIFEHQTIAQLAAVAGSTQQVCAEQGWVQGPVPLTPIQHWFFEQQLPQPHYFNQAFLLQCRKPLTAGLLQRALQQVLEHHDALRLRFVRTESGQAPGARGGTANKDRLPVERRSICARCRCRTGCRPSDEAAGRVHGSLDLQAGPLLRAVLFELGAQQPQRLLLSIHHLVVDGVSWRILLEDLHSACAALAGGGRGSLAAEKHLLQELVGTAVGLWGFGSSTAGAGVLGEPALGGQCALAEG